jgi:lipopolysaccharide transport system permease protein
LFCNFPGEVKLAPGLRQLTLPRGASISTLDRPVTVIEPPTLRALRPMAALRRLAQFGDLLVTLSAHRLSVRYKQSRLGVVWAVLQPLAIMLAFTLVFSLLGGAPSDGIPYALFAYAALVPWTAFASGLSSATGALTGHAALLTKVAFPREILPLTYVVVAVADAALASVVLAGLMVWYHVPVTGTVAWALLALVLLALWLTGIGLLLSAVHVRHRDVGLAVPVLLQVWMFATPVVYPLSLAKAQLPPSLYTLYTANPMAGVVDTFRRGAVLHTAPDGQALLAAVVMTFVLLPIAYAYFKYADVTMADVV